LSIEEIMESRENLEKSFRILWGIRKNLRKCKTVHIPKPDGTTRAIIVPPILVSSVDERIEEIILDLKLIKIFESDTDELEDNDII